MSIPLISKSEKARFNFVSGAKYKFACTASCNVYYKFQDCIYIALNGILYVIGYFISSQNWLCLLNRYQDTSLSEKRGLSGFIKFLLIIHAYLHLQNSIYLNFLHLQRNDLPIIIDFKIH